MTDAHGVPLAVRLTGANVNDITQLLALLDAIPPLRGKRGRPRHRPQRVQGDRAYDSNRHRAALRALGIQPVLGRRRVPHGSGLGIYRWVVERTHSWMNGYGKLRRCAEKVRAVVDFYLFLAAALVVLRQLIQRARLRYRWPAPRLAASSRLPTVGRSKSFWQERCAISPAKSHPSARPTVAMRERCCAPSRLIRTATPIALHRPRPIVRSTIPPCPFRWSIRRLSTTP